MASTLSGAITLFQQIGVYDVILPFILVFVMVFALLDRTRVLGTESVNIGGKEQSVPKKGLNAMIGFVIAFFAVASSQVVGAITRVSANMVILVILVVFLLMLVGSFYEEGSVGKDGLKNEYIRAPFLVLVCVAMVLILLDGIRDAANRSILDKVWLTVSQYWNSSALPAILFMVFVIGFVAFVSSDWGKGSSGGGGK